LGEEREEEGKRKEERGEKKEGEKGIGNAVEGWCLGRVYKQTLKVFGGTGPLRNL
jgi:hypothetical protein